MATWNIAHRTLSEDGDAVMRAGGVPLRFYHFTGYDSGDGFGMLHRYAADQRTALKLWDGYKADLKQAGQGKPQYQGWLYGQFSNGVAIPVEARRLYRFREDLKAAFPDPFRVEGQCFWSWWQTEGRAATRSRNDWQNLRTMLRPFAQRAKRIWLKSGKW